MGQRVPSEAMSNHQLFTVRGEYITLGQLLKATGYVDRGADAKEALAVERFLMNGEPENRRGRKIRPGDVIELPDGSKIEVTA